LHGTSEIAVLHGTIETVRWVVHPSPVDELAVAVDETGVCRLSFASSPAGPVPGPEADPRPAGMLADALAELDAYFAGDLTAFTVPLSVPGGSSFERAVWAALAEIPYGEMVSYGEIARSVGDRDAARAVGIACNRNPIALILPCHRVVGADGKLVGFGGGLPRKRFLLELEARVRIEHDFAW
jgi:methylated-DNA-[protein]-cysteine S-methyltransferase